MNFNAYFAVGFLLFAAVVYLFFLSLSLYIKGRERLMRVYIVFDRSCVMRLLMNCLRIFFVLRVFCSLGIF